MEKLSTEALAAMRKMGVLSRLHMQTAAKGSTEGGLYRSQMMVLAYLAKSGGPRSQKEIAERFEISKPAATEMLKRLETLGMVSRVSSEADQRVKLVSLTEKGRSLTEANRDSFMEMNARMAEGIEKEDLEVLSRVLDIMIANLKKEAGRFPD